MPFFTEMDRYLRASSQSKLVALGPKLFRKQLLRLGTWAHPDAPGGKLEVTKDLVSRIIENFNKGVRDDVPVPMGHDLDALKNAGHVVGLEQAKDGSLWGILNLAKEDIAEDVEAGTITGGSSLIAMNHKNPENGEEHGPTLVHFALTNAPYIKGLAGFERVALGEQEGESVVIALAQTEEGKTMDLKELLEKISEIPDEELMAALKTERPDLFTDSEEEPDEKKLEEAKAEGQKELVAALAEKGITVSLSEEGDGSGDDDTKIDVTKSPEYVALSEQVENLTKAAREAEALAVIDQAIKDRKVLPAQRDALKTVALGENGMETLKGLIPEETIVDTSEHGVTTTDEPGVKLSEEEAKSEAKRLVSDYFGGGEKEE